MRQTASADIEKLRRLVARLRAPDGCPWDREQTLDDVRAYLVEEAHEAAAAIDSGDRRELAAELGDLVFQAVFVAHLAEEEGAFDLAAVIDGIHHKMIERHPHVFGEETLADSAAVKRAWELRKLTRGDGTSSQSSAPSLLAGVPKSLPAATAALRIGQKAAGVGFDWPDASEVRTKVDEELEELDAAMVSGDRQQQEEELGDLLFSLAQLARHLKIDPEAALARSNQKFRRRFGKVENLLAERGRTLDDVTFDELEDAWQEIKRREAHGQELERGRSAVAGDEDPV